MNAKRIGMAVLWMAGTALGQGSLTPPGAPAPTMKTLSEIDAEIAAVNIAVSNLKEDARTPLVDGSVGVSTLSTGGLVIYQSGSYYLTENLSVTGGNAIRIDADGVTVDLNGFTLRSSAATATGTGIRVAASNVSILNGHIDSGTVFNNSATGDQYVGAGFVNGIYANASATIGIRIRDITIQGVDRSGIYIASRDAVVQSCIVNIVGNFGIRAGAVTDCRVRTCGGNAIDARTVTGSYGKSTGANGIIAVVVANSYGYSTSTSSTADGIYAYKTVQNSYGTSAGGSGIKCSEVVANSCGVTTATTTSADGIYADRSVQNSYGTSAGDDGIQCSGVVINSYGVTTATTTSADGIYAMGSVQNSYGLSSGGNGIECPSGVVASSYGRTLNGSSFGIKAYIANGCRVIGGANISYKYNMP